jgi:hypothetical protein
MGKTFNKPGNLPHSEAEIRSYIDRIQHLSVPELREEHLRLYGEPSTARSRDFLWRKLAWRVQELVRGGISERAQRRAEELADDTSIRTRPPRATPEDYAPPVGRPRKGKVDPRMPGPGTIRTRTFQGREIMAIVHAHDRIEYEGKMYPSLTAIAREVSGSNYNGFTFFSLNRRKNGHEER